MHGAADRGKLSRLLQPIMLVCAYLSATAITASTPTRDSLWDNDAVLRNITQQFDQIGLQITQQNVKLNEINTRLIAMRHELRVELSKVLQVVDPDGDNDLGLLIDSRISLPEMPYRAALRNYRASAPPTTTSTSTTQTQASLVVDPLPNTTPTSPPTAQPRLLPSSCSETANDPRRGLAGGIFQLQLPAQPLSSSPPSAPFYAYCLPDPHGNGTAWTVVQRRQDGSTDFYRDWADYQQGFGNLNNEFFIGLERLHALTQARLHELWIELEDFQGVRAQAHYENFAIGDEASKYVLYVLGRYQGDAGDSLRLHAGHRFTTHDADNDASAKNNCAVESHGGWWYADCHDSNLNGKYLKGSYEKADQGKGIDWSSWHGHLYSLKYVHMAIRPV